MPVVTNTTRDANESMAKKCFLKSLNPVCSPGLRDGDMARIQTLSFALFMHKLPFRDLE